MGFVIIQYGSSSSIRSYGTPYKKYLSNFSIRSYTVDTITQETCSNGFESSLLIATLSGIFLLIS